MEQLQEMKARLEAATPGPWSVSLNNARTANLLLIHSGTEQEDRLGTIFDDDDADFIAHAPEVQAKLIAALEAVSDVHQPTWQSNYRGGREMCRHDTHDWPCSTVRTITEALA